MLELKNISKQFGQHKIFDNYNLTVEEGKILAIVGPSGGGKTTLLRMLAGLETIDSGQIIYENKEIPLDQMESRNLLGFVFQDFQLFPHLTVLDNLTLSPIKTMGMSKEDAQKKAQTLLDRLGLGSHGNAYPYSLSGGQKQRVAFARAMMIDPKIVGYDEPTSALDPELRQEVEKLILQNREIGITQIVITHELVARAHILQLRKTSGKLIPKKRKSKLVLMQPLFLWDMRKRMVAILVLILTWLMQFLNYMASMLNGKLLTGI